jgi:hypothetical protein
MGLLFTAAGVAACLVGNTGGSVASILWTGSGDLSLFGLMLLQLAGLGLCFFGVLAAAAALLRDARVLLPHDRAAQRRLFCCGELCPRATRRSIWGEDGAEDAAALKNEAEGAEAPEEAAALALGTASGGAAAADAGGLGARLGARLGGLSQAEFMLGPMGLVNSVAALSQWYATPPQRTPPLLQALLPVAMIAATPPLSKLLLRDRKVYTALVPALAIGLVVASVIISMLPTMLEAGGAGAGSSGGGGSGAGAGGGDGESNLDTLLWSLVFTASQALSAAAFVLQQLYLVRAGALLPGASPRRVWLAMLRNLAYNQVIVVLYVLALFWIDVLPWFGSSAGIGELASGLRGSLACSVLGAGEGCAAATPLYALAYLLFYVVYLGGVFMVSKDSAVFSALLSVAMTALLDLWWFAFPATNPDPGSASATPAWSVCVSFALSATGIVMLKRWEGQTPAEEQFDTAALACEVAEAAAEAAVAAADSEKTIGAGGGAAEMLLTSRN